LDELDELDDWLPEEALDDELLMKNELLDGGSLEELLDWLDDELDELELLEDDPGSSSNSNVSGLSAQPSARV